MPRAQLPEDSSAVDMDILFPLHSVIGTELCPSSIPQIIHFVLFLVFSLVILIILRLYIPREPSSVPPREDSENDQAEVGEWLRIGNKYITLKDYRILLKELENLEIYTFLSKKRLKKLSREGSSHHLPRQVRPGPVYKRAPARNHRPRGGRGKASPTSFHVSPRAPPAPLASMPSSVPKTSVESLGLPSRETPHAGRWRQGSRFPQPGCANAAGRTRHQNPRHSHGHQISDIHEQLGIS
ncbi:uncharacterized protein C5orf60 isoform X3 [Pan troglodytes]|uniref:uncharacterized protein C5orf60 isoform X3 n=1 Tax=Pan troglodytes TaxID=9598 RepID=UPI003013EA26